MTRKFSPYSLVILSFIVLIFVGTILLTMPFSYTENNEVDFFDALFTATSAVTVTGLVVNDVSSVFTIYGKIILMVLIQMGGLGLLTFSSAIILLISKKIGFHTKKIVAEGLNHVAKFDIYSHIKKVVFVVFVIEAVGALFLFGQFITEYDFFTAGFYAVFHSVSAFCNAGFGLLPNNLENYVFNPFVNFVIAFLIIFGGLGFAAIIEIYEFIRGKRRKISINTKFSSLITIILLILGTLLFFVLEYGNETTLANKNIFEKLLISFFHSTSLRTAGFNTIPLAGIGGATVLFCAIFMFIGASPGSTGSGVKTTTIGILFLGIKAALLNREYIEFSKRRISWRALNKASALTIIAMFYILTMIIIMAELEPDKDILKVAFELMSAFGTVGLSMGVTPHLTIASKVIIIFTMFLGRVGPLTIVLALSRDSRKGKYKYPKENILIG
ncbi:TrkH family potassium uptake protein [Capnocytophaga cynodegmi]|uniref:Potassium uptake protein, TrkH family n=1 Tax=Capnocytophaga cynodegmi TaxID=28189 RepID=A0A0B7HGM5_9FLAO|nr:TrkH family potassium uptake protein [Capnocytophaga cynodegmi]CEN34774.1 Potassium uptake protein, TrkH family [Capnocytophaga cynodegmi]CEN38876.1 Potassium uptake protein, TrkH family [Capnocytophaga cynodegmi]